jgi:hypothetical protein
MPFFCKVRFWPGPAATLARVTSAFSRDRDELAGVAQGTEEVPERAGDGAAAHEQAALHVEVQAGLGEVGAGDEDDGSPLVRPFQDGDSGDALEGQGGVAGQLVSERLLALQYQGDPDAARGGCGEPIGEVGDAVGGELTSRGSRRAWWTRSRTTWLASRTDES